MRKFRQSPMPDLWGQVPQNPTQNPPQNFSTENLEEIIRFLNAELERKKNQAALKESTATSNQLWIEMFGKRLKRVREAKGLTQKELGKMLGLGPTAFTDYENGVHYMKLPTFSRLVKILGVDAYYLLGLEVPQ